MGTTEIGRTVAVLGSGSWGTAQVKLLTANGNRVNWWMRRPADVEYVKAHHHNHNYLTDVRIDPALVMPTTSTEKALDGAEAVFLVVPAAFVEVMLQTIQATQLEGKIIVSGIKGIVPGDNLLVTDYLERYLNVDGGRQAIIAGPCHAEEVALEKRSYLTIGATNLETAGQVARLLEGEFVKCSTSQDLYGLEYSAILKNIVAIACGIAHGLFYGDNFMAVLVANALNEIEDFLNVACPQASRRIADSGYAGDLLVTSYSPFSRNRTFGGLLGRGYSVQAAQMEMNMVAEGYYASRCVAEINKKWEVRMPIIETMQKVLYERLPATVAFQQLAEILH